MMFWPERSVASTKRPKELIGASQALPIGRQTGLLAISRSNLYYPRRAASEVNLALMRRIDE